jgi:uncharacterized protein
MLAMYPLAALFAWRSGLGLGPAYGLQWRGRWWLWLLALFTLALIAKTCAIVVGLETGIYVSHGPAVPAPTAIDCAAMALVTFIPSLAEDILTRGLWRHSPLARSGATFVAGTAAVYTLNHVWRLALGPAEWVMVFCFGLAYGLAFWRTGSLWAAVGLHWGWNFAGQAVDAVWQVDVVDAGTAKLVSASTHLVLAAAVLAVTSRATRTAGLDRGSSRNDRTPSLPGDDRAR